MDKNTEPIPFKPSKKNAPDPDNELKERFDTLAYDFISFSTLAAESLWNFMVKKAKDIKKKVRPPAPAPLLYLDDARENRKK